MSFWHPLLVSSWRRRNQARPGLIKPLIRRTTVTRRIRRRGEHGISRKTIARGMPGDFRCTCGDYTRVLSTLHTRLRVHWAPGIPCALCFFRGLDFTAKPRANARRECGVRASITAVIARSDLSAVAQRAKAEATKQSILLLVRRDGLLRGACHRAHIRATRWLAMTAPRRATLCRSSPRESAGPITSVVC